MQWDANFAKKALFFTLSHFFLISGLFCRITRGLITTNFFFLWLMLELNLLFFIALIAIYPTIGPLALKYFIVQTVGSLFVLIRGLCLLGDNTQRWKALIVFSLLLKGGIVPFHSWLISVIRKLPLSLFFLIRTVQKVLPIYLLITLVNFSFNFLILIIILTAILGSLLTHQINRILAYSSIFRVAWLLAREVFSCAIVYLSIYAIALSLCLIAINSNLWSFRREGRTNKRTAKWPFSVLCGFLRIAGIPPILGFLGKIIVLFHFSANFFFLFALIASSIFILFLYRRIFFNALLWGRNDSLPTFSSDFTIIIQVLFVSIAWAILWF